MSTAMEKLLVDMDLKGFSTNTKKTYLLSINHFSAHFGAKPEALGEDEIRQYLHHEIVKRKQSSSSVIVSYSALRFFFETTLGREWNARAFPRVKRGNKLPDILTRTEVLQLLDAAHNLKHKAILMTAYAAGLRASEIANLKVGDIDSKNMEIFIRQGKGQIDRYSLLSSLNLAVLRQYYKQYRPVLWLFPGPDPAKPINVKTLSMIFRNIKQKIGLQKNVSIHSLRHSFATHLLEDGVDICHIQKLLGHKNISTTSRYLHLTRLHLKKIRSPLDTMPEPIDE